MTQPIGFAGQLYPEQMQEVAARGFRTVINNRPDFEEGPQQPTAAQMQAAAEAQGLQYVHQPVVSGAITEDDVRRFAELLNTLPKPCFFRLPQADADRLPVAQTTMIGRSLNFSSSETRLSSWPRVMCRAPRSANKC